MSKCKKIHNVVAIIAVSILFFTATSFSQVTDIDGNNYGTVEIGSKIWMSENLNVEHYRNGDPIPQVQDSTEWEKLTTGAWCYYENNSANGSLYGKLYNWYAVTDPRGLAPEGWHVSYITDWKALSEHLGESYAGKKLKTKYEWLEDGEVNTNESGFNGMPGGYRGGWKRTDKKYEFINKHIDGVWWSLSKLGENQLVYGVYLNAYSNEMTFRKQFLTNGLSVRCVKN